MHLVFGLSENRFIWSNLRSKLRQFLAHKDLLNEVLCALLLQSDKAVDFQTYADLLLTYCSCAPRIRCALLLQRDKAVDFETYANLLLT